MIGWRAHPNCNLVLNCTDLPRHLLRQKLQDGNHISFSESMKRPPCNIHQNEWRSTRGTQLKRRVLHLESHSYNKSYPSPKAYRFSKFDDQKPPLLISKLCLTFLSSVRTSLTSNQVRSLVHIYHQALLFHPRASTLHGVSPPSSHVVLISHVTSCIHLDLLFKRISSPITSMIDSVWKFLPGWRMSPLTSGYEKILFPF
jgi:hypothetical protein